MIADLTRLIVAEIRKIVIDADISPIVKDLVHEYLDYGAETSPQILLHSISVALEVKGFCDQTDIDLGFTPDQAFIASLLHDYGRFEKRIMSITTERSNDAIFNGTLEKPRLKLSKSEWNEIMKHTAIGYKIIKAKVVNHIDDPTVRLILDCVLHHQRWFHPADEPNIERKKSYPGEEELEKLGENKEIPTIALLTSLADAYSARQDPFRHFYQKPQTPEVVIPAMKKDFGIHFDEFLGAAFLDWEERKLKAKNYDQQNS